MRIGRIQSRGDIDSAHAEFTDTAIAEGEDDPSVDMADNAITVRRIVAVSVHIDIRPERRDRSRSTSGSI
ncbi:MAG: hypothetical protein NTAFB09_09580 [Nitrosospira sp.]